MYGARLNNRSGRIDGASIVNGGVGCSGTDQSIIFVAEGLAALGHEVYIASKMAPRGQVVNGVFYYGLHMHRCSKSFDVVVCVSLQQPERMPAVRAKHIVLWLHCQVVNEQLYNKVCSMVGDSNVSFVYPSRYTVAAATSSCPFIFARAHRHMVVYNPISTSLFHPEVKRPGSFIFSAVWTRGGAVALEAFNRLEGVGSTFSIFGYDTRTHRNMPSCDKVKMYGSCDKQTLAAAMNTTDYMMYPLLNVANGAIHHDTFGCVVAEALSAGVVVLTLRAGCLPEVYGDALVYVDSTADGDLAACFAEAVLQIESDPEQKEAIRQRGVDFAREHFDQDAVAARWAELCSCAQ